MFSGIMRAFSGDRGLCRDRPLASGLDWELRRVDHRSVHAKADNRWVAVLDVRDFRGEVRCMIARRDWRDPDESPSHAHYDCREHPDEAWGDPYCERWDEEHRDPSDDCLADIAVPDEKVSLPVHGTRSDVEWRPLPDGHDSPTPRRLDCLPRHVRVAFACAWLRSGARALYALLQDGDAY